ncbi:hybrid sensor histidine kinase/response regulator [Marinobacter salinexigens]|nr:ATP-binding protein [Marinobacter salinexigens]
MIKGFRKRLSYRLTRDTVLVAMTLGLILNIVQITLDFFNARESMEEEIQALLMISLSPASQIAYNIDVRLAEELLDGLLRHPATIDARILDSEKQTMAAASKRSPDSPYRWVSDLLFGSSRAFSQELKVPQLQNLPLGQLTVTIDTYHYGLQFLQRSSYTLVSGLFKSLVLSAALLGIFYLVLTRPMLNVISSLSEARPRTPEKMRLPVPAGHTEDEIGTMVGIINQHLETIDSTLAQLRLAESAMKNYSSRLEQEVEDRTREISEKNDALQRGNRALVRAKEDAVRRARSRANFLASMSHEIRTPLNGVLGMLGLALEGEADPSQRDRLEIALNAGESLLGLLNDILDISKVEAGKLNLENIPFSSRALIEECATLHAQQARRKNIDLVTDLDPELPENFLGDPTRVRQIVNNLVSNAIKFTDEGSVRIRAYHKEGIFHLDVIDTGIGMSGEGLQKIFSPFSQADADTTRLYGGTGLGLALCRQLVERMHGQIAVTSEEGKGTHFTVTLPLPIHEDSGTLQLPDVASSLQQIGVALDFPDTSPHGQSLKRQLEAWGIPVSSPNQAPDAILIALADTPSDITGTATRWTGAGVIIADTTGTVPADPAYQVLPLPLNRSNLYQTLCRAAGVMTDLDTSAIDHNDSVSGPQRPLNILLVEDNQVNQLVASSLLKKMGHQVYHAENGLRAIEALQNHAYDLVLMDCQMPVMDGYAATRKIRENPDWRTLPIIAMTANVMQGDRDDCIAAGMNDYITKPYKRNELRAAINRWTRPFPQES